MDDKDGAQSKLDACKFPYGKYEHFKGPIYWVFATSIDEATLEPLVHYESLTHGTRWTRTMKNFTEDVTLPSGDKVPRFKYRIGD